VEADQKPTRANAPVAEVVFTVTEEDGRVVARWDDPSGKGGITTQSESREGLEEMLWEAALCHFDDEKVPTSLRYVFLSP
jgi:hypothetical protein